jgi:hypothetical protein
LEEFKILLLSNGLLTEPNLIISKNLSAEEVNKLQVLCEEYQLIQITIQVLLTLADMVNLHHRHIPKFQDESDDAIRDFLLNSAGSLIDIEATLNSDVNK